MQPSPRCIPSPVTPDLLVLVAKGNQDAFRKLYDWSTSLLFTLALKILGDRAEAADLLQEVFYEIWRKLVRYDAGRGAPMPWLVALTRSRAIGRLRARGTQRHRAPDPDGGQPDGEIPDPAPGQLDTQADRELRSLVLKVLGELPEAQRQALDLSYYEGLSPTEIAARLNQPVGTIKTRITLGMSTLKIALGSVRHKE